MDEQKGWIWRIVGESHGRLDRTRHCEAFFNMTESESESRLPVYAKVGDLVVHYANIDRPLLIIGMDGPCGGQKTLTEEKCSRCPGCSPIILHADGSIDKTYCFYRGELLSPTFIVISRAEERGA